VPPVRRRTSKGNEAQGRTGHLATGNGREAYQTRQRSKASEPTNGKGATATETWSGCWRGESSEGVNGVAGSVQTRNAADLMTGSGMQQARDLRAEEAIGVVRNHEDGTRFAERDLRGPKRAAMRAGVDARQGRWRGIGDEGQGRWSERSGPNDRQHALEESQDPRVPHDFDALAREKRSRRDTVGTPRRRAR